MTENLNIYLFKKNLPFFIVIELVSLILIYTSNSSLRYISKLSIINLVLFGLLNYQLKIYLNNVFKNRSPMKFSAKQQYITIFFGSVVLIGSFFISFKFYSLGFAGVIFPLFTLILTKFKDSNIETKKFSAIREISYLAMSLGILMPLLLDVHYNMLQIPLTIYLTITIFYFSIASIILYRRFLDVKWSEPP